MSIVLNKPQPKTSDCLELPEGNANGRKSSGRKTSGRKSARNSAAPKKSGKKSSARSSAKPSDHEEAEVEVCRGCQTLRDTLIAVEASER